MDAIIKILVVLLIGCGLYRTYEVVSAEVEPVKALEYRLRSISVREIIADPYKYSEEIAVSGRVSRSFNFLGLRCYKISDLSDPQYEILIMPHQSIVPKEGTLVRIKGHVKQVVKFRGKEILAFKATE